MDERATRLVEAFVDAFTRTVIAGTIFLSFYLANRKECDQLMADIRARLPKVRVSRPPQTRLEREVKKIVDPEE